MAPLPAQAVAEALRERIPDLDALKLQKLLYYCQGHHLATFGARIFSDSVSAWDHGPVVASVWYAESHGEPRPVGHSREPTEAELNTIGYVVSRYGRLSGPELRDMTHDEPPYRKADAGRAPKSSTRIEDSWIEEHFNEVATQDDPQRAVNSPLAIRLAEQGRLAPAAYAEAESDMPRLQDRLTQLRRSMRRDGVG